MSGLLCGIFFVTGATSLAFEALWFHQAGLALGSSVWATSLVLAGFMGGLAVGNAGAARLCERVPRPLRLYAGLEAAVAVAGVALVLALPGVGSALAGLFGPLLERPWLLNPMRFVAAFFLLLIPSSAMGATLPLLTQALSARDPRFGSVLGRLYGWNTLGAVTGVLITEFALIEALGVRGAALCAGSLGLAAAAAARWLAPRFEREAPARATDARGGDAPARVGEHRIARWLLVAFGAGFALLALEVVWFRFLLLFVVSEASSFAVMLALVLTGIASGGLVAGALLRRVPDAERFAGPAAFGAAVFCVLGYAVVPLVWSDPSRVASSAGEIVLIALPLMVPVSFLSGAFFTLNGATLRRALPSAVQATGHLAFANTLGSALGSLAAGFALLPVFGMERSLFLLSALYVVVGALLLTQRTRGFRFAWGSAAAALLATALFPFGAMQEVHLKASVDRYLGPGGGRVVAVRETPLDTIVYLENHALGRPHSYRMITNGYSMSASFDTARRYMKLYVYWPAALHPKLENALLISYGVGSTAKALTDTASLERIDIVDISRDVIEMSEVVYPDPADHPVTDPRVHVHIEDGRYYLETTPRRYDLITGEPPPPTVRGVVNLYTREHFQRIYERLAEGGITTYWLPVQSLSDRATLSILRAFCAVFSDCSLWHGMGGNLMMVGTRGATGPVSAEHFARQWAEPATAPEMAVLGFEHPAQLGALFIGDAAWLADLTGDAPILSDNFPKRVTAAHSSGERYPPLDAQFWDVGAARERFAQSPLIERLWPAAQREASLAWFDTQGLINQCANGNFKRRETPFPQLHHLLTRTKVVTPALWMLGSDRDLDPILRETLAKGEGDESAHYLAGLRHLAARDWAQAANAFAAADSFAPVRRDAFRYRIYAMCMAGECEGGAELARNRYARVAAESTLPHFWVWMREAFGVDPRSPRILSKR